MSNKSHTYEKEGRIKIQQSSSHEKLIFQPAELRFENKEAQCLCCCFWQRTNIHRAQEFDKYMQVEKKSPSLRYKYWKIKHRENLFLPFSSNQTTDQ